LGVAQSPGRAGRLGAPDPAGGPGDARIVCSDKSAPGNALLCTHCNLVAHPHCVERTHWDLDKSENWTRVCYARDVGEVEHTSSCGKCNEATFVVGDLKPGIDRFAKK
jgi:hypothetical protein